MTLEQAQELLDSLHDDRLMLEIERRYAKTEELAALDDRLESLRLKLVDLVAYIGALPMY